MAERGVGYRVHYRHVRGDNELLYEADDVPIPRVGDLVTFPSGWTWLVSGHQRVEHHIGDSPNVYRVNVFVEDFPDA